jgi:predicted RNase H-like nuclease (RuvC/YqgF family)
MNYSCERCKKIKNELGELKNENVYLKEKIIYLEMLIKNIKNELADLKNIQNDTHTDKYFFF